MPRCICLMSPLQYYQPEIFAHCPAIVAAESTRHGGVSQPPFDTLNLGLHTDDALLNVEENRRRFFSAVNYSTHQVAHAHQVHGTAVAIAHTAGHYAGFDALITNQPGILLSITVADCVPILLYDSVSQSIAAVHAGWRGTVGGVVEAALSALAQGYGTRAVDCLAYIGTCIDACHFEVGPEVAAHFDATSSAWDEAHQKHFVDLKAANRQQLLALGLLPSRIEVSPRSTFADSGDYFSHRRDKGHTGRMLAVIGLRL